MRLLRQSINQPCAKLVILTNRSRQGNILAPETTPRVACDSSGSGAAAARMRGEKAMDETPEHPVTVPTDESATVVKRDELMRLFRQAQVCACVNNVTHDVNNLLGAAMGYSELLGLDGALPETTKRALSEIVTAVRRASVMLNNLTDVARKERPDIRMVEPAVLVERALDLYRYEINTRTVELIEEYEPGLGSVIADLPMVERAITFIVTNAIEALENTGQKQIRATAARAADDPGAIEIGIWNSAPPVPEADRERIFEPMWTTKGEGHLGLGLPAARDIIERHYGELLYDPKRGFVLRLPRTSPLTNPV